MICTHMIQILLLIVSIIKNSEMIKTILFKDNIQSFISYFNIEDYEMNEDKNDTINIYTDSRNVFQMKKKNGFVMTVL